MVKRRRKRKGSFTKKLTLLALIFGAIYGLAEHYYPEQVDEFRARFEWLINPYYGLGASIPSEIEDADLLPVSAKRVQVLKNIGYVSGFSNLYAVPLWVGYVVKYPFKYDVAARLPAFEKDMRAYGSAEHKDYSNSGFDRGHMAPNYAIGRTYGQTAQMETFYMTNIVPQKSEAGGGIWKRLESHIANKLSKKYGKVLVFAGPVLREPIRKLNGKVAIPEAFYAVVMVKSKTDKAYAIGFIVPQTPESKSIWDYCVPIDEIEAKTGIDFFKNLPDDAEEKLESNTEYGPFI